MKGSPHLPQPSLQGQALAQGVHIHITRGTLTTQDSELAGATFCWCCTVYVTAGKRTVNACGGWTAERPVGAPRLPRTCFQHAQLALCRPHLAAVPNYWEDLRGTRAKPIVIEAADGKGSVVMDNMNLKDVQ